MKNQTKSGRLGMWLMLAALVLSALLAMAQGRFGMPPETVVKVLLSCVIDIPASWSVTEEQVIWVVRGPRVLLAALVGAGLALSGAALQSVFQNPLADSQILGVSSGSAFGGVLGIVFIGSGWPAMAGAFAGGIAALLAVFLLAGGSGHGRSGTLMLVLSGLVVAAVSGAGIALVKQAADPDNQLPAITFWMLGSLAGADPQKLLIAAVPIIASSLLILGLRFHLTALAVGEADARNLGVKVGTVRLLALAAAGLATAAAVAVSGVVGWVGLVVPHLVRLSFGADHRWFFVNTMLGGAAYLVLVDTAARSMVAAEIPLGALTALLGAPIFAVLLRRLRGESHD